MVSTHTDHLTEAGGVGCTIGIVKLDMRNQFPLQLLTMKCQHNQQEKPKVYDIRADA